MHHPSSQYMEWYTDREWCPLYKTFRRFHAVGYLPVGPTQKRSVAQAAVGPRQKRAGAKAECFIMHLPDWWICPEIVSPLVVAPFSKGPFLLFGIELSAIEGKVKFINKMYSEGHKVKMYMTPSFHRIWFHKMIIE